MQGKETSRISCVAWDVGNGVHVINEKGELFVNGVKTSFDDLDEDDLDEDDLDEYDPYEYDPYEYDPDEVKQKPWRREQPKVGRNEPCPCGSGKKYKKCCGAVQ